MSQNNVLPKIAIDGHRLTENSTGVGRYLSVLLNQWSLAPDLLPFHPIIIKRTVRKADLDPWKNCFQQVCHGSRLPGLIWENTILASREFRHLPLFAPANLVPYRWKGPVVLVVHDTFCEHSDSQISTLNRIRFRSRYRRSAQRADLIITPSQATAHDVHQFFQIPISHIKVIPPGIPSYFKPVHDKFTSALNFIPEIKNPYVLFVGKKSSRREFPAILEAVQRLRKSGLKINLVAVGPSKQKLGSQDGLIDLGYISDQTLIHLYQNAIALIWPSSREGFGLPLAEAMACGCPIITTPVNAISEVAGQACLTLPDCSPDSIKSAVQQIIEDPQFTSSIIRKGLEQSARYDPKVFADQVSEILKKFAT